MEIRPLRAEEMEQAWEVDREAFHTPKERRERFFAVDPARLVGAFEGGRLLGLCAALPFGQFFGGRAVPMGGFASMAVVPHRRGEGLAGRLVQPCLAGMRERGEVISSLYPATTKLYRRFGWEAAGSVVWRSVAPRLLEGLPRPGAGRVRPAEPGDSAELRACYARFARECNGLLDRPESWWELRDLPGAGRSVFVAEDAEGAVAGYVAWRQRSGEYSGMGGPFRLVVDDFVWTTRDAGLALWRLLGSWATQVERIYWRGGSEDASYLLLPEQVAETLVDLRWMTRVVDAPRAVAARGFALGIEVEVPLELVDEGLPENSGRWWLRVREGRGRLERGGPGGARLDIGAFSALYTGWASSAVLLRAGRLAGVGERERSALDAAFAGPTPWLLDEF